MKAILMLLALAWPAIAGDPATGLKKATFAGGCFWCLQPPFDGVKGVARTTVGYAGGKRETADYEQVSTGLTGHVEAIEVVYDPKQVSYQELLDVFWMSIDPTQADGQFADRGSQYQTAIYYHDESQRREAEASKKKLAQEGRFDHPIVTPIAAAPAFYPAEEYHQKYYLKNKKRYDRYHQASGRESFFKRVWGEGKSAGAAPFDPGKFARDQAAGKTVLLHFHADWCPTCRKQQETIQRILRGEKSLTAYQVDYDNADQLKSRLRVRSQSTLIVFKGAAEVARAAGVTDEGAIARLIEKAK